MSQRRIQRPKHALQQGNPAVSPNTALSNDPDVNWTDAADVVHAPEENLLGSAGPFNFGNITASGTPHFDGFMSNASSIQCSPLEMSWGAFFAKKSPPLDQPQFSSPNNSNGDNEMNEADVYQNHQFLTASFVGGQDKFLQPFKAPAVSTQFKNGAFHIEVPQLDFIQRFYQFGINVNAVDENRGIKPHIDGVIEQYLETQFEESSRPIRSYVTYQRDSHRCTVLLIFPCRRDSQNAGSSKSGANASKDQDLNTLILKDKTNLARNAHADDQMMDDSDVSTLEWIEHFLKFPPIRQILDTNAGEPAFTEMSSTT